MIHGYFDTVNAGPKIDAQSYRRISTSIATAPGATVFLSDVQAELDAARQAGWRTVGVRRPGERWFEAGVGDHPEVATFDDADAVVGGETPGCVNDRP